MENSKLRGLVWQLTIPQLEVLVKRFTGSSSNAEACRSVTPNIADSTFSNWLKRPAFLQVYNILEEQGADIMKPLIEVVYEGLAARATIEQAKLIETDNSKLDSRGVASKYSTIGEIMERYIPKKFITEHTYVFRLADVVPPRLLNKPFIEGELVEAQKDANAHEGDGQGNVPQEGESA